MFPRFQCCEELALQLAQKKLGERPALGSQVALYTATIQMVDGELVWVVPLYHSGFFKWLTNMDGTPGYIVVSATNTNDVRYVEATRSNTIRTATCCLMLPERFVLVQV